MAITFASVVLLPPVTFRDVEPETVPDVAVIVAVPAGPELGELARPVALI